MIKRLQHSMRWLFMRVEALFNAAFGDRLNPLITQLNERLAA